MIGAAPAFIKIRRAVALLSGARGKALLAGVGLRLLLFGSGALDGRDEGSEPALEGREHTAEEDSLGGEAMAGSLPGIGVKASVRSLALHTVKVNY